MCAPIIQSANTACANMSCMQCAQLQGAAACKCQQNCYASNCWTGLEQSFSCILSQCAAACM
jgi:hypothetical protein